jgi:hypothetical protein
MSKIPDAWSLSKVLDQLIASAFFKSPKRRTMDDIAEMLAKKDSRARGRDK